MNVYELIESQERVDEAAIEWIVNSYFNGDRDEAGDCISTLRNRGLLVKVDPWESQ